MSLEEERLRILSVEDSLRDCEIIINELSRLDRELFFKRVGTKEDLIRELDTRKWDVVVSDHDLPNLSTLSALEYVRGKAFVPFVLFSDRIGEEGVVELMRAGVDDVVLKSRPERLAPVVKRLIRESEMRNKESMAKKLAQEALAAKEQMLAIVSHDIKNPLFAIQLESEMLLRAVERNPNSLFGEEVKIQATRILKTTERMKSLITDLLDKNKTENALSKLNRVEIDAVKLLQEVLDALRPLINEKDILLKFKSSEKKMLAHLDRNKMFQVFMNLLNNAIKYTPEKGSILITMNDLGDEFTFQVSDSGPGLKEENYSKVFEKYWTGDSFASGTGLGLHICKVIIEAHNGHIWAQKNAGEGASFSFTLPKDTYSSELSSSVVLKDSKDKKKKIYVVDDDEDLREVISWVLGKEGYSIHSFHCPREALNSLKMGRHIPELIVADFHMDEMKGSEFLLRKNEIPRAKGCPVLMISASPQEVYQEVDPRYYKEVITKPIDLEGLVNNIRKYLND